MTADIALPRLNIGCGPDVPPEWVNVDKSPSVRLARVPLLRQLLLRAKILSPEQATGLPPGIVNADASKRLPFDSETVGFVYSGHMIEHLSRWQGLSFMRECHRVLVPGGVVRLSTPDLRMLVDSYVAGEIRDDVSKTPADSFVREYGAYYDITETPARRLIRRLFSGAIHQWLYDAESLSALLREAGFTDVSSCEYRVGRVPGLAEVEHRPRSLFIEGVK